MKGTQPSSTSTNNSKALIEEVLELTPVLGTGPDNFTNVKPLWRPPGNRGIFGGIVIAQTLVAAQKTVAPDFPVRSMHCYFVFAGDGEVPILYHVERLVDTTEYVVRSVSAKQGDRLIFSATLSFTKFDENNAGRVDYSVPPPAVEKPADVGSGWDSGQPFQLVTASFDRTFAKPEIKKFRQWALSRGKISSSGGQQAHLGALAYLTDSFLLGTVYRAHLVRRFSSPTAMQRLQHVKSQPEPDMEALQYFQALADIEKRDLGGNYQTDKEVGMMVSLSHSIYFHNPAVVRADDWLLSEMETPWAGDGRGMVVSRWWSSDGVLIATCVQEGVMRMNESKTLQNSREGKL
ncbi:Histidine acid phosphatase [Aspergillus sclerotialis]|uniref:Histidine acid phosphatase n=1 Tax=Aspergillus sclerotialis TaxID=2070753 RepID=A0A3A2ZZ62_9EURO|nr:Histidine acid phosphatase [Aspergillus sclerotialis]